MFTHYVWHQNLDSDTIIDEEDTPSVFFLSGPSTCDGRESALAALCQNWELYNTRDEKTDNDWIAELSSHLSSLVERRIDHVQEWVSSNLARFKAGHANIEELRRALEDTIVDMKANVQLCKMKCASCHLSCLLSRRHDPLEIHDCKTSHQCSRDCEFDDEHPDGTEPCGYRCVSQNHSKQSTQY